MDFPELIESISNEGLKDILCNLDEPFSYPRAELIRRVRKASQGMTTKHVLGFLSSEELKEICRKIGLPVGGTNSELMSKIVSHKEKTVTFNGLVEDIRRWKPAQDHFTENKYRDDLHRFLEEKGYKVTTKGGRTMPDLLVNKVYPIELKHHFATKPEWNRAEGQIMDYIRDFGCAILVVCSFYADREEFDEITDDMLIPEVRSKWKAILKQ